VEAVINSAGGDLHVLW